MVDLSAWQAAESQVPVRPGPPELLPAPLEVLENRLAPAAHTWTGASLASANWSDAANWAEGNPVPGESNVTLMFPDAARTANYNDLEGLTVAALRFTGTGVAPGDGKDKGGKDESVIDAEFEVKK